MHEMSLCESIRQIVIEQAQAQAFSRVEVLRLELGRFACVEKEAMDFAFEVVMRGSPAEGAKLVYIDIPAEARCFACGKTSEIFSRLDLCPNCGSGQLLPLKGEELRIKDMEVL